MYIDLETLITAIYFIVNNWYLREGHCYLDGKVGRKPVFTDSELLTLMIFNEFMTFKSERKFVGYIYANHLDMFPDMVDQSQFNRRSCSLRLILNQLKGTHCTTARRPFGVSVCSGYCSCSRCRLQTQ